MDCLLHVGASKTGSSAIQVSFARNRARLAEAGLWYPPATDGSERRAERGLVNSGNAVPLAHLLIPDMRPEGFDPAAVREGIAAAFREAGDRRPVLFSCEMLAAAWPGEIGEFAGFVRAQGRRLRVVFYVRHLLDHAVALYQQILKQGRARLHLSGTPRLADYLATYRNGFERQIEHYRSAVGAGNVEVPSYERERADLTGRLLARLLPGRAVPALEPAPLVNRSPSHVEMRLYERLNLEEDAGRLCLFLSDALLNAPPPARAAEVSVPPAAFEAFAARHADTLERINAVAFGGEPVLRMVSDRLRVADAPPLSEEEVYPGAGAVLLAVMRRAMAERRPEQAPRRPEATVRQPPPPAAPVPAAAD